MDVDVTLGDHRLCLGDCLEVLPTLTAASVDLVVADLPYGITANPWDCAVPLAGLWNEMLRVGTPQCVYVFTATLRFACALLLSQPRMFRYDLVLEKNVATGFFNARRQPLRAHELILVFASASHAYNPQMTTGAHRSSHTRASQGNNYRAAMHGRYKGGSARYPRSVVRHLSERVNGKVWRLHPTQKPVALLAWLVRTYSAPGATVLDPTSGVASLAVACQREGRRSISIERDPDYYARGVQRVRDELAGVAPQPKPRRARKPANPAPAAQATLIK